MKKYSAEWFWYHLKNNKGSLWLLDYSELYLLVMTKESCQSYDSKFSFRVNQWEDLEYFEETESWHNKKDFLENVNKKKLAGENCVTLVINKQLAYVSFYSISESYSFFRDVDIKIYYPLFTTTAYSAYVHPEHRGKGIFSLGKKFISNYLFKNTETKLFVSAVRCENRSAHKGNLASGLHSVARLERSCRFGYVTNRVDELHPNYKLRVVEGKSKSWQLELIE